MVAGRVAEGTATSCIHNVTCAISVFAHSKSSINRRTPQTACINPDQPKYVSTRYLAKNPFFLSKFYLEFLSVFFLSKIALFLSLHFEKKVW